MQRQPTEILNSTTALPQRIFSVLTLVNNKRGNPYTRTEVCDLIQPGNESQDQIKKTVGTSITYGWLKEDSDHRLTISSTVDGKVLESLDTFRGYLRSILIGNRQPGDDDYRLNLLLAWFVANDERVFSFEKVDNLTQAFDKEMLLDNLDTDGQGFNSTKYNSWKRWMSFLDLGWTFNGMFIIDITAHLLDVIPQILELQKRTEISQFLNLLSTRCPALDYGALFTTCREETNFENRNTVSMALSHSLRYLHDKNIIQLDMVGDADYIERLYPAANHPLQQVSHITRLKG